MALTPRFTFTSPNKVNAIWTDGTFKLVFIPGTHSTLRNLYLYCDIMALGPTCRTHSTRTARCFPPMHRISWVSPLRPYRLYTYPADWFRGNAL